MALVMNASIEDQKFTVYGNHFHLKPGQIKLFQEHLARFIAMNRKEMGLVVLPEECEDMDRTTPEFVAIAESKRKEGIENRVRHLRELINNNNVSLRRDLQTANIQADPKAYASDGEIAAYEELSKYQASKNDEEQKKIDRLKKLEQTLKD